MSGRGDGPQSILILGPGTGWHASQLRQACIQLGHEVQFADYESLSASVGELHGNPEPRNSIQAAECDLDAVDAILTRTMPAASMERITFRLSVLHAIADGFYSKRIPIVNPPRALEWAIDKYSTLARISTAGFNTPPTRFVQSRREATDAFHELGGDCVVKPLFGGEGRGVMRIQDAELAWYTFSSLDQMDAVLQIQSFIPPGGSDTRMLVIGDDVYGIRRHNPAGFRSNVSAGARCEAIDLDPKWCESARSITRMLGLVFASVDMIDNENGPPMFLEVNAIPGWKGSQSVIDAPIATRIIESVVEQTNVSVQ